MYLFHTLPLLFFLPSAVRVCMLLFDKKLSAPFFSLTVQQLFFFFFFSLTYYALIYIMYLFLCPLHSPHSVQHQYGTILPIIPCIKKDMLLYTGFILKITSCIDNFICYLPSTTSTLHSLKEGPFLTGLVDNYRKNVRAILRSSLLFTEKTTILLRLTHQLKLLYISC